MDFKDYSAIIGVARDATQDDIKRACRRFARKYHPDINKTPEAESKFKDINESYEVLKDADKRSNHRCRRRLAALQRDHRHLDVRLHRPNDGQHFDFGARGL